MSQGREIFAARDLLDLAILDCDGRPVGRVDDVELDDRGRAAPKVATLLVGGMAFSDRFGGLFRRWFRAAYERLHDEEEPHAHRVPWNKVRHVNSRIDLKVTGDSLGFGRMEEWAAQTIIGKIPGSDHAPSQ